MASINLFNIDRRRLIRCAPIKGQCSKNYFYGKDLRLETALQAMEGMYSKVVKEIQQSGYKLNNEHRKFLRYFWLLQYLRTEDAAKRSIEMFDGIVGMAGTDPHEYKMNMEESVYIAMKAFVENMGVIDDLKACLLINKSNVMFITSDAPAVLTNKWYLKRHVLNGESFGLGAAGNIVLLPLTPRIVFLGYDRQIYRVPHENGLVVMRNRRDVLAINEHQFLNCRANVYVSDDESEVELLESYEVAEALRPEPRHRFTYAVLDRLQSGRKIYKVVDPADKIDKEEAILKFQVISPNPSSWPHHVHWRKKGSVYYNGTGVGYIRQAEARRCPEKGFSRQVVRLGHLA